MGSKLLVTVTFPHTKTTGDNVINGFEDLSLGALDAYPITCLGAAAANYTITYISGVFTVTQEPATVQCSGDTIGQTGASLTLQATVSDSVPDSTIGDITKI
jgi:hypothetical protein